MMDVLRKGSVTNQVSLFQVLRTRSCHSHAHSFDHLMVAKASSANKEEILGDPDLNFKTKSIPFLFKPHHPWKNVIITALSSGGFRIFSMCERSCHN